MYVDDVGLEARDTSREHQHAVAGEMDHQCSLKQAWHCKHVDREER